MRLPIPFLHRWVAMKWGHGLDCRECRWCGRFEVYAFGSFHKADRAAFSDAAIRETGEPKP